jgi:hypothetical protein
MCAHTRMHSLLLTKLILSFCKGQTLTRPRRFSLSPSLFLALFVPLFVSLCLSFISYTYLNIHFWLVLSLKRLKFFIFFFLCIFQAKATFKEYDLFDWSVRRIQLQYNEFLSNSVRKTVGQQLLEVLSLIISHHISSDCGSDEMFTFIHIINPMNHNPLVLFFCSWQICNFFRPGSAEAYFWRDGMLSVSQSFSQSVSQSFFQ